MSASAAASTPAGRYGRAIPWGPKQVLIGLLLGAGVLLVSNVVLLIFIVATGSEFRTQDVGDVFEKAGEIAGYADERLAAAARAQSLPEAPSILADQTALKFGLGATLVFQAGLIAILVLVSRQRIPSLVGGLHLDRYRLREIWRPAVVAAGCYVMIGIYSVLVDALNVGPLEPQSTVPFEIVRDPVTLTLTGIAAVVGAPLAEELFYRGLVFGGLLKWGFWPAALLSGAIFSGVHLDLGSLIPFFIIGVVLAWLFWRRGNLWETIIFHVLFNSTSFVLLVATEA